MVEKRQLRKRDRVSRLFERDGRATSLAEGFPLLHIKHILQLLHSAVRHISKILSGCLLPAILFPPSTPSRGTTVTRSELREGALVAQTFLHLVQSLPKPDPGAPSQTWWLLVAWSAELVEALPALLQVDPQVNQG